MNWCKESKVLKTDKKILFITFYQYLKKQYKKPIKHFIEH